MKKFGKRALAILLSCFLLIGTVSVTSAENAANAPFSLEDNYKGMPDENGMLNGLKVEGNTITGSDFDIEMAQGHHYMFDNVGSSGLAWWGGNAANEENSAIKFGFPEVNSGFLKVSYTAVPNTVMPGNMGSLVNGTLENPTKVVEVLQDADSKIGPVSVMWEPTDFVTTVDLSTGYYKVTVKGEYAKSGYAELPVSIDGIYFDITSGSDYRVIKTMKVETSDTLTATFVTANGIKLGDVEIIDGKATPPAYEIPTGAALIGWMTEEGELITDIANATLNGGATYTAVLEGADTSQVSVSTEEQLRDAIAAASTDSENPTTINLLNDIEVTTTSTTNGNLQFEGKYIIFKGGHDIIKANKAPSKVSWTGPGGSGFIIVDGGEVTFDGVGIDLNIDDDRSNGGRAFYVHTTAGSKITVKNAVIKDGGFEKDTQGNEWQIGMVAFINQTGTFVLGENTEVTGFVNGSGEPKGKSSLFAISNDWQTNGTGTLEIDGAEVYGNTINGYGLIYGFTDSKYILKKGYFHDNTNPSGYDLYTEGKGNITISGEMQLEGAVRSENGTVTITSALLYPLTIERSSLTGLKTSEMASSQTYEGYYGDAVASGNANYNLRANDLTKLEYADETKKLYIDTTPNSYGNVYVQEADLPYWPKETNETMVGDPGILTIEDVIIEYAVTFKNELGAKIAEVTSENGIIIPPSYEEPAYTEFKGWAIEGTADVVDFSTTMFSEGDVFVPVNKAKYSVIFKDEKGEQIGDIVWSNNDIVAPPAYTAPIGTLFMGWAIEGTTDVVDFTEVFADGTVFVPVNKAEYRVRFVDENGELLREVWSVDGIITPYEGYTAPEGLTFAGWAVEGKTDYILDFADTILDDGTVIVPVNVDDSIKVVSDEAALRAAIADASEDSTAPTTILLTNDIVSTDTSSDRGNFYIQNKYIIFKGGHDIIKAHKAGSRTDWGGDGRAFIGIDGGELTFDGVGVDLNADDSRSNGGRAFYVGEPVGSKITVKNAVIKDGGFAKDKDAKNLGMAVWLNNNGTFVLGENAKITGFAPYEGKESTLIAVANNWDTNGTNATVEIDGGEITGNTISGNGIIYGFAKSHFILKKGSIHDNINPNGYDLYLRYADKIDVQIGGEMQIEGVVRTENGPVTVTSALSYPLTFERATLTSSKTSELDASQTYEGYYGEAIAAGTADYSLDSSDLALISYADEAKKVYIDTTPNSCGNVYVQDANLPYWPKETTEAMVGDPGIIHISEAAYTVTFEDKDGSVLKAVTSVDGLITPIGYEAKPGEEFEGWAVKGTTEIVDFEATIFANGTVFVPVIKSIYTVTFNNEKGEKLAEVTSENGLITPPAYTAPGHLEFVGWAVYGTTETVDFETEEFTQGTVFVPVNKDKYSVTFKNEKGEQIGDAVWSNNDLITPPAYTVPDGFRFIGWAVEGTTETVDFTSAIFTDGTVFVPVNEDITRLTASNEAELRAAIEKASKNSAYPTTITLLDDIEITDTSITRGNFIFDGVFITFTGGYDIIKAHKAVSRLDWGGEDVNDAKAFMNVFNGAEIIFDGVGVDLNADDDRSNGGRAFYIAKEAKVTVKNAEVKDGGFAKEKDGENKGMAVCVVDAKAEFILGENSKITGFAPYEGKEASLINLAGSNAVFEVNGGEISGNTVNGDGVVTGGGDYFRMLKGKFADNTGSNGYDLCIKANNSEGGLSIGGEMQFEGAVRSNRAATTIVSALRYPITFEYDGTYGRNKTDDHGNNNKLYYDLVVAYGSESHTLTQADLDKITFADTTKYVYLDPVDRVDRPGYGRIFLLDLDEVNTQETVIYKSPTALFGITDVALAGDNLTVSYGLNESVDGYASANIQGMPAAAIYKGDALVAVTYDTASRVTLNAENAASTISVKAPADWATNASDYTVKAFIWNAATLAPMVDVATYIAK